MNDARYALRSLTMIGIAPPGFRGPSEQADLWTPAHRAGGLEPNVVLREE